MSLYVVLLVMHTLPIPVCFSNKGVLVALPSQDDLLCHMVTNCRCRVVTCIICKHRARLPHMLLHLKLHQTDMTIKIIRDKRIKAGGGGGGSSHVGSTGPGSPQHFGPQEEDLTGLAVHPDALTSKLPRGITRAATAGPSLGSESSREDEEMSSRSVSGPQTFPGPSSSSPHEASLQQPTLLSPGSPLTEASQHSQQPGMTVLSGPSLTSQRLLMLQRMLRDLSQQIRSRSRTPGAAGLTDSTSDRTSDHSLGHQRLSQGSRDSRAPFPPANSGGDEPCTANPQDSRRPLVAVETLPLQPHRESGEDQDNYQEDNDRHGSAEMHDPAFLVTINRSLLRGRSSSFVEDQRRLEGSCPLVQAVALPASSLHASVNQLAEVDRSQAGEGGSGEIRWQFARSLREQRDEPPSWQGLEQAMVDAILDSMDLGHALCIRSGAQEEAQEGDNGLDQLDNQVHPAECVPPASPALSNIIQSNAEDLPVADGCGSPRGASSSSGSSCPAEAKSYDGDFRAAALRAATLAAQHKAWTGRGYREGSAESKSGSNFVEGMPSEHGLSGHGPSEDAGSSTDFPSSNKSISRLRNSAPLPRLGFALDNTAEPFYTIGSTRDQQHHSALAADSLNQRERSSAQGCMRHGGFGEQRTERRGSMQRAQSDTAALLANRMEMAAASQAAAGVFIDAANWDMRTRF